MKTIALYVSEKQMNKSDIGVDVSLHRDHFIILAFKNSYALTASSGKEAFPAFEWAKLATIQRDFLIVANLVEKIFQLSWIRRDI